MARVHRTIDTRIFKTAESPVRREQAEDRERLFRFADRTAPPDRAHPEPETRNATLFFTAPTRSTAYLHRDRLFPKPALRRLPPSRRLGKVEGRLQVHP
jgi:hypothetical protein